VKTDQVIFQQAFDQLPRFGQGGEQAARRPWNMQEKADAIGHARLRNSLPSGNMW
jgi:hypothetical protein